MFHIIDDEEGVREMLVELTAALGYRAISFASARHYLERLNSEDYSKPTAIITDLRMPGMNGYELMGYTHKFHPDINFVVMSGETALRHEYMDRACMYLKKPFEVRIFGEVLHRLKQCERGGAAAGIGCTGIGDRGFFGVQDSTCPKLRRPRSERFI